MNRIEEYSFGSIRVDGHSYKNDLIIYPDRIRANWWRKEGHKLQVEDLSELLADPPDILVVGQGDSARMKVDERVTEALEKLNVRLIAEPTRKACGKFNEMLQQGKNVVAALHLTC